MKYSDALKVAGNNIGSIEWAINNTEPSSFVVRNMGDLATDYLKYSSEGFATNEYRMVGNTKFDAANLYRTYWCVDPQYSSDATLTHGTSSYVASLPKVPQLQHLFIVTRIPSTWLIRIMGTQLVLL